MAETKDEQDTQALDPSSHKRKPDLDCVEQGETKKQRNPESDARGEEGEEDRRQKARALDKGKGKMVIEEEENSDSDSDSDADVGGVEGDGDDSDFFDDPLAEVDLENILPSRTRRRAPQAPGAYLVNDQDVEDNEEDEDEDLGGDGEEEDSG